VCVWLGLMERSISDFKKAILQSYKDPAGEAMGETFHGRGKAGEGNLLLLPFFLGLGVRNKSSKKMDRENSK
jgi:hypothetical protein